MIGRSIARIIPAERLGEEDQILDRLRAGESIELFETKRVATACLETDAPIYSLVSLSNGRLVAGDAVGRLHWLEVGGPASCVPFNVRDDLRDNFHLVGKPPA